MMTCDLGEKNEDLLSLVMIAKDEEKGIENAILSCIEYVDNIVIAVDSRSTDKTLELANLYADTVKTFE
jgi:glycosyltransferase involved in cell wall biosynthesis